MTGDRETILSDVRRALGASIASATSASVIAAQAATLLEMPETVRPVLLSSDPVQSFLERLSSDKIAATIVTIESLLELPAAVTDYLHSHQLSQDIAVQPVGDLEGLDWEGAGLGRSNTPDEGVAVGIARWGIAETGSLVFHSGSDTPVLFQFLPLHHIVAVRASTIVSYLEDYWAAFECTGERHPRNVNLITGASGTTDIEGSLVIGAHGPRNVHVVVIHTNL